MAPQYAGYVATPAGAIGRFMSCATILAFWVALAGDLCHWSQALTDPASNGHLGHAVRVGEDGRRAPRQSPKSSRQPTRVGCRRRRAWPDGPRTDLAGVYLSAGGNYLQGDE